tara:strand:+ start:1458 stop:1799 length:342 start_codon:yes stop_codon:yes gene_type:complete
MRKCNQCKHEKPDFLFKNKEKKTCRSCEFKWWHYYLRLMVRERKLTPIERLSSRVGYMGAGLLVAGQWTLNPWLFITGFICVMIQTTVRRQWNLVLLQFNGLVAWTIHLINSI